jgi:hypothetical protein
MFAYVTHNPQIGLSRTKFTLPGVVGSLEADVTSISIANSPKLVNSFTNPLTIKLGLVTDMSDLDDRSDTNCVNADLSGWEDNIFLSGPGIWTNKMQLNNLRIKPGYYLGRESYLTTFGIEFALFELVIRIDYDLRQSTDLQFIAQNL